jgi:hypothetical protein
MNHRSVAFLIAMGIAGTALADGQVDAQADGLNDESKERLTIIAKQHIPTMEAELDIAAADTSTEVLPEQGLPIYVPPRRGAPKTRVGGGTRSSGSSVQLALLAPEHTGLTGRSSPMLYWWLSKEHEGPFEFVVMVESGVEPVLRFRQENTLAAGIHSFDLAAAGLSLEPGITYRWSVAIVRDEAQRARDVVALATMEYVIDRSVADQAETLAGAGLWYDAFALASAETNHSVWADLLEQVSLDQVAAWSRGES